MKSVLVVVLLFYSAHSYISWNFVAAPENIYN